MAASKKQMSFGCQAGERAGRSRHRHRETCGFGRSRQEAGGRGRSTGRLGVRSSGIGARKTHRVLHGYVGCRCIYLCTFKVIVDFVKIPKTSTLPNHAKCNKSYFTAVCPHFSTTRSKKLLPTFWNVISAFPTNISRRYQTMPRICLADCCAWEEKSVAMRQLLWIRPGLQ